MDAGGLPCRSDIKAQRWRCTSCGATVTELPQDARPRSLATIAFRDAVALSCFEEGYAPAASRYDVDEKTARAMWAEWAAPRELDLPSRPPEFLGLHTVRVAGSERTLVTDVAALAVVDVLQGADASDVVEWLDRIGDAARVDSVALAFHQPYRDAVSSQLPGARMLMCPSHARSQGIWAFLSALRIATRWLARIPGRNVGERPRTFAMHASELSAAQREEMGGWDASVIALHAIKENYLHAFEHQKRVDVERSLSDVAAQCISIQGATRVVSLIAAWGGEIASGAVEPALAPFSEALGAIVPSFASRRPVLSFDLMRGLAVLKEGRRVPNDDWGPGASAGVAMESMAGMLSN